MEVRDEDLANVATVSAGGNEVVRAACAAACKAQAACKATQACWLGPGSVVSRRGRSHCAQDMIKADLHKADLHSTCR